MDFLTRFYMGKGKLRTALKTVLTCTFFICVVCAQCPPLHASKWQWQNPTPQGNTLNAVWAAPSGEVFAVGNAGIILCYDSREARAPVLMDSPTSQALYAVWGSSPRDVFAVGECGAVLHYDGSSWVCMHSGTAEPLWGVWGGASNDVFAVGSGGTILHYDAKSWTAMKSPTTRTLRSVWGISGSHVFAAGYDGTILHYNGMEWTPEKAVTRRDLFALHGTSGTEVLAVGAKGTVLSFDGISWKDMGRGLIDHDLKSITVGYDSRAFMAADHGVVLSCDGKGFTRHGLPTDRSIHGMWRTTGGEMYLVGENGTFLSGDGQAWTMLSVGPGKDLSALVQGQDNDVLALGENGTFARYDGSRWETVDAGLTAGICAAWRDPLSGHLILVGENGTIIGHDGLGWKPMTGPSRETLRGVWGASGNDVFAVGDSGTILHYDGLDWTSMNCSVSRNLCDIWGVDGKDVYAVGELGTMLHYDGEAWSVMPRQTAQTLRGIWGCSSCDVFAVGDMGAILHYDGVKWEPMQSGTLMPLNAVWGSSSKDVFTVGGQGAMLHYDGLAWTPMDSNTSLTLKDVWGRSGNDVFALGQGGTIIHYGGAMPAELPETGAVASTGAHDTGPRHGTDLYASRREEGGRTEDRQASDTGGANSFQARRDKSKSLLEFLTLLYAERGSGTGGPAAGAASGETAQAQAEPAGVPGGPSVTVASAYDAGKAAPDADEPVTTLSLMSSSEAQVEAFRPVEIMGAPKAPDVVVDAPPQAPQEIAGREREEAPSAAQAGNPDTLDVAQAATVAEAYSPDPADRHAASGYGEPKEKEKDTDLRLMASLGSGDDDITKGTGSDGSEGNEAPAAGTAMSPSVPGEEAAGPALAQAETAAELQDVPNPKEIVPRPDENVACEAESVPVLNVASVDAADAAAQTLRVREVSAQGPVHPVVSKETAPLENKGGHDGPDRSARKAGSGPDHGRTPVSLQYHHTAQWIIVGLLACLLLAGFLRALASRQARG